MNRHCMRIQETQGEKRILNYIYYIDTERLEKIIDYVNGTIKDFPKNEWELLQEKIERMAMNEQIEVLEEWFL